MGGPTPHRFWIRNFEFLASKSLSKLMPPPPRTLPDLFAMLGSSFPNHFSDFMGGSASWIHSNGVFMRGVRSPTEVGQVVGWCSLRLTLKCCSQLFNALSGYLWRSKTCRYRDSWLSNREFWWPQGGRFYLYSLFNNFDISNSNQFLRFANFMFYWELLKSENS